MESDEGEEKARHAPAVRTQLGTADVPAAAKLLLDVGGYQTLVRVKLARIAVRMWY